MNRKRTNTILLLIDFLLIVGFLIILSINNKLNYSLQAEQDALKKLQEDNKILVLKLETANDLNEISRIAEEDLGMVFPKKIEYIYE